MKAQKSWKLLPNIYELKEIQKLGMVKHCYNPNIQEAETKGL
jgi:hypothetical protein